MLHRIAITKNTGEEYVNLIQFDEKQGSKFKSDISKLILKVKKDKNIRTRENATKLILAMLGKELRRS